MSEASFFHLSTQPEARAIVIPHDSRADGKAFFSPRPPLDHADEISTPRIRVAPRVWQCLVGLPARDIDGALFIYRLRCAGAIRTSQRDHNVGDAHVTDEHWITDEVIRANGGEIALARHGVLPDPNGSRWDLWDWLNAVRELSPGRLIERDGIWIVDESKRPPEWRIRDPLPYRPPKSLYS